MGDVYIQRGVTGVLPAGTTDTTFTTVGALTSAFALNTNNQFSHAGSTTGNAEADDMSGLIELTDTSTLTFTRITTSLASSAPHTWELWEYTGAASGVNEFIVRSRNTVVMATSSDGTGTLDTTPTNIDRCVPFITGVTSTVTSNGEDHLTCTAYINDSGGLVVERGGGDGSGTTTVQVVTVEFTGSNWSVGHARATGQTGDTGSMTMNTDSDGVGGTTFDVTSWATAFIHGGHKISNNVESLASNAQCVLEGASTTTVAWRYDSGHAATTNKMFHIVQHDDMVVTRFNVSDAGPLITTDDITSAGLTDLSESAIIGTAQTSGTGDALSRGFRNFKLDSLTQASSTASRTGNAMQHQFQIIDLSAVSTGASSYKRPKIEAVGVTDTVTSVYVEHFVRSIDEAAGVTDTVTAAGKLTETRPIGDTVVAGWESAPTPGQDLWAQIDEAVPSDTDYIYTEDPNP